MMDIQEVGFDRPKIELLLGTVKYYARHLFICTGEVNWPGKIEEAVGFVGTLAQAVGARGKEITRAAKVNACDEPSRGEGHDVLVFPDMVRYVGLTEADIPILVEDHLIGDAVSDRLQHEALTGQHLFVCCHANRDERCGYCGPILADLFADEIRARGLQESIQVRRTSHVGGHQYAGNVLIYPGGDWYGYVTPADVERIIEQHLLRGEVLSDLWRGRMGLTRDEQLKNA